MNCDIDHLVIGAASLAQGTAWCEATFGVVPGPGGVHPLMGTHNRLLSIGTEAFPNAYLEIIAIDPEAAPPGRASATPIASSVQPSATRRSIATLRDPAWI